MANVYDKIVEFYAENSDAKAFFDEKAIEKHIRNCAWKGDKEEDLLLRFNLFEKLLLSAMDMDADTIYELLPEDYLEIFYELAELEHKNLNEQLVKKYIAFLEDLYLEREEEGFDGKIDEIEFLKMFFYDEGKFSLMKREDKKSYKSLYRRGAVSDMEIEKRDRLKNNWLDLVLTYFRKNIVFKDDIKRACEMYYGDNLPTNKGKNFRDYFIFDYHLIQTDETPLGHFYRKEKSKADKELCSITEDMLNSRFTCFYVKYVENDTFICRDMFREREFILPFSSADFPEYKNMIFYGHIEYGSVPEPTYLGWFSANERLQKRIAEEILSAYKLYRYSEPKANFTDFFSRHALATRKLLDAIVNSSRLNVIPKAEDIEIIKTNEDVLEDYEEPLKRLVKIAKHLHLGAYSIRQLEKFYHDFIIKSKYSRTINESRTTLLAVIYDFININLGRETDFYEQLSFFDADAEKVTEMAKIIRDALKSEYFDPRYLTEEGFSRLVLNFSDQNNF
ncbi:MAG: hypothetical protein IKN43_01145 [Selenomonadaceae bacterium]|nr:hypothetical protein [Selenomonadaceae bacterium]